VAVRATALPVVVLNPVARADPYRAVTADDEFTLARIRDHISTIFPECSLRHIRALPGWGIKLS
jgi:hypothetical protein